MANLEQLVEELVKECKTQDDFKQFFKALKQRGLEVSLSGELTEHLGYDKHVRAAEHKNNSRNGFSKKTIRIRKIFCVAIINSKIFAILKYKLTL